VNGRMDFIQVMVVSTFDILFIVVALTVDGIGYAAWLICAAINAIVIESFRILSLEGLRDIDAKAVIPYLPIVELFRAAKMQDPKMGMSSWREVAGA